jgi:xylulokinase
VSSAECVIGLDLGTSFLKAVALDMDGRLCGFAARPTPLHRRPGGRAEHPLNVLEARTIELLRELATGLHHRPLAIATTSMGETGALVAHSGRTLPPLISWLDTRAEPETRILAQALGAERLYEITGHRLDSFWGIPRLMWLQRHRPDAVDRAVAWLAPADLATYWLSGAVATSPSLASRTMALDQATRTWSEEILQAAGLSAAVLPPVVPSGTPIGALSPSAARRTGLPLGLPVVVGGHDRLCGALAARAGQRDVAVDSAGTAETLVVLSDRRPTAAEAMRHGFNCYADVVPAEFAYSARIGLAGALIEWVRSELFGSQETADELIDRVPAPITFGGVLCYPSFGRPITPSTERTARPGALLGLTIEHTRLDILRAALESACFSLRANVEGIEAQLGRPLGPVRVEGRVAAVGKLMQLRADVLGRAIESTDIGHATAVGAALLARVGCGAASDVASAGVILNPQIRRWEPDPARAAVYGEIYARGYQGLERVAGLALGPEERLVSANWAQTENRPQT